MKHKRILSTTMAIVMTISIIFPNIMTATAKELPENTDAFLTTDDMSIQSTNSLGTMLAAELSAEQQEQMQGNGYAVSEIEMDNRTATVSFQAIEDCTLVVGIYDEANETLLGSGRAEVSKEQREAQVEIEIMEIPEYFYVKGYLINSYTLAPLSTTYSCSDYTQEMQDFYAKTIYDFDADRVLNFDEDPTNNFAVYTVDTIILEPQEGYNNVISADNENAVYVIENADETVLSLQQGDILAYEYGENNLLIVKVDSLAAVGDTVTITGADSSLQEVFEFLHIDVEQGMEDATIYPADGVEVVETKKTVQNKPSTSGISSQDVTADISTTVELKQKFIDKNPFDEESNNKNNTIPGAKGSIKVNGELSLSASAGAKFRVTPTTTYCEIKVDYASEVDVSINATAEFFVPMGSIGFAPAPGVIIELVPSFILKFSAGLSVGGKWEGSCGFRANSADESQNGLFNDAPVYTLKLKSSGSVFVGIDLNPRIKVISKDIFSIGASATAGLELSATNSHSISTGDDLTHADITALHDCYSCIDGDINLKFSIKFTIDFLFFDKIELKLLEVKVKLGDFYYSMDRDEFGWRECPYKIYRVNLTVLDRHGRPIEGAAVTFEADGNVKTFDSGLIPKFVTEPLLSDAEGKLSVFLPTEIVKVHSAKEDYENRTTHLVIKANKDDEVTINQEKGNEAEIRMFPPRHKIHLMITDTEGNPIQYVFLYYKMDRALSATTNSSGEAVLNLYNGTYEVEASAYRYARKTFTVTVEDADDTLTVELLKDGEPPAPDDSDDPPTQNPDNPSSGTVVSVQNRLSLCGDHSAYITDDGSLYMWGLNDYGQLGNGTTTKSTTPIKIMNNVVSVSLEDTCSAAITEDGSLYMWGRNNYGQLGNGLVGNGTTTGSTTPIKIMDNVVSVSFGYYNNSAAITEDGSLYMWGYNYYDTTNGYSANPTPIKIMDNVVSVSLGQVHSAAITEDGSLYMLGYNNYGQLGDGTDADIRNTPIKIMDNVVSVSLGRAHSAAITEDGSLYMWGYNWYGQLGNGTTTNSSSTPIKIMDNAVSVSLWEYDSAAITEDGSLYMWGYHYSANPTPIKNIDNVVSVSRGDNHTAAITEDGSLYMWGYNHDGQLGNGTTNYSANPTPIKIMDNVVSVSLGGAYSAAITEDGSLYMWGRNYCGQLGNGTTENSSVPIKIDIPPAEETYTISETYNAPAIAEAEVFEETAAEPAEDSAQNLSCITTMTDLYPNTLYNFYVLHAEDTDDPLSPANLHYLTQFTADSAGTATLSYNLLFADADAVTLAVPAEKSISGASIQLDDIVFAGGTVSPAPIVTVNGIILTEGIDYVLSGDVTVIDYGAYLLTITGIGEYSGEITTAYFVVCAHDYVNGICHICGEIESIEETEWMKGDINLDGRVTIADAVLLMRIVAEDDTLKPEAESIKRADIDGDGLITILDCTYLLDMLT